MQNSKKTTTVAVYSQVLGDRDYLRSQLEGYGFNTICFENENICFDNLKAVQPKIVIARTDSSIVGWRFVYALNTLGMDNPLVFVSNSLSDNRFGSCPLGVPVHALPIENKNDRWRVKIDQILSENHTSNGKRVVQPFLGESESIEAIRSMLPILADSKDPILIVGEAGTGKELIAITIAESLKTEPALVKIDCEILQAEISLNHWLTELVEREANAKPVIILLNNIHKMVQAAQADILMLLDKVENQLAAPSVQHKHGIRIIATSELCLDGLVKNGTFRKDLYFRINVIPISIPPLRDRKADISLLMDYFIINACIRNNRCVLIPSKKTREKMYMHDWPGNVDELRQYMDRIASTGDENVIFADPILHEQTRDESECLFNAASLEELPQSSEIKGILGAKSNLALKGISSEFVIRTEKRFMKKALELTHWNRKRAAQLLRISYKSMLNKMKTYDIT